MGRQGNATQVGPLQKIFPAATMVCYHRPHFIWERFGVSRRVPLNVPPHSIPQLPPQEAVSQEGGRKAQDGTFLMLRDKPREVAGEGGISGGDRQL